MGEMRDSDWSRANLLRSDWLPITGAIMTTVAGCEKLLQRVESGSTFCNKICTRCVFYGPKLRQTCFSASDVTPVYGVTPA